MDSVQFQEYQKVNLRRFFDLGADLICGDRTLVTFLGNTGIDVMQSAEDGFADDFSVFLHGSRYG